ncbi:adenylate kinase [Spirochaeta africana]|uniref:Adenylate kinase n=1 Tax=Spirochaeta africana (strain ATCC 700263 / DSM 8902 / Z-7692) TaxID=889378 RepID=H9UKZ6_SPIAZ|nr:adenylate kinase [Spirochaeta africana]AFG38189.1 adenylate kinase family protein [Spirochaeta africana DSM 8902]
MKLVFLGPPGAGKGTMAGKLALEKDLVHISTGDIFRAAIRNETELGKKVKGILASGDLVPDELTIALVQERLEQKDTANGYILDGFPRTITQADALSEFANLNGVINFAISDTEVVRRLSGRRVAPASGRIYHIEFDPPKTAGKDDETGEELIIRDDDKEDAIKHRLEVYRSQTQPLIDYYRSRDQLHDLNASPAPDAVYTALLQLLDSL